jgi:hypothetical protein
MQVLNFLLHPTIAVKQILRKRSYALRPTWIELGHGGVDPDFHRALNTLVDEEIARNLSVIDDMPLAKNTPDRMTNYLILCTQVRTNRLVRFTQYHATDLNKNHKRVLSRVYKHISAVRDLRSSALNSKLTGPSKKAKMTETQLHVGQTSLRWTPNV